MGGGRISWTGLTSDLGGFSRNSSDRRGIRMVGGAKGMDYCSDNGKMRLP